MRISDYRLSYPMKEFLIKYLRGDIKREDQTFPAATAEALYKRNILDSQYKLTELGNNLAEILIEQSPKPMVQYNASYLERMIEGLKILIKYDKDVVPYPCDRKNKTISIQSENFYDLEVADLKKLAEIGWYYNGHYLFEF